MKIILIQTFILLFFLSCGKDSEQSNKIVQPEVNVEKSKPGECQYNEKTYKIGERFPSIDQCNTCECSQDSTIGCTTKSCN